MKIILAHKTHYPFGDPKGNWRYIWNCPHCMEVIEAVSDCEAYEEIDKGRFIMSGCEQGSCNTRHKHHQYEVLPNTPIARLYEANH